MALAAIALLVITSCSQPAPPEPPKTVSRFDLVADVPIAAAQIVLAPGAGASIVAMEPLQEEMLVRAATADDVTRLAWIGSAARSGPQVRVTVERPVEGDGAPVLLAGASYTAEAGADLGTSVLRWRASADTAGTSWDVRSTLAGVTADGVLEAWYADHPLGDLRRTGAIDVRDALRLLDRLRVGGWADFERYHGDLDGNGTVDGSDVETLLTKVVDLELPAHPIVKPAEIAFVDLIGATAHPAVILVANGGTLPFADLTWEAPAGTTVTTSGGIPGMSAAIALELAPSDRTGWVPGFVHVFDGAGTEARVRVGHLVALVGGQSNAVGWGQPVAGWPGSTSPRVRALRNDYRWADAAEPLDSAAGQLDEVSRDDNAAYSFGTRLGQLLAGSTGFATYLIPSAKGGSQVTLAAEDGGWLPGAPTDRSTLFGSAVFRSRVSAALEENPVESQPFPSEGGPVTVLVWYQGESDSSSATRRAGFVDGTRTVMTAFKSELGVPIIYVQLASHEGVDRNRQQHWVAERQRRMETGSGEPEADLVPNHHMVVAFDLPRSDQIHLSAFGQRLLAERLELAIRQHALGEDVDGTGPRLTGLVWGGGTTIVLRTTHTLATGPLDASYFTVYDGPPNGVSVWTDLAMGTNTLPIASVSNHPTDPKSVVITLSASVSSGSKPYVVYRAPAGIGPELGEVVKRDLIRSADGIGLHDLGLPLPAFGPLAP